jgi:hypothetical protein
MAADDRRAAGFILSGRGASDAVEGRLSPDAIGRIKHPGEERPPYLLMDQSYADDRTRPLPLNGGIARRRLRRSAGYASGNKTKRYINRRTKWNGCSGG